MDDLEHLKQIAGPDYDEFQLQARPYGLPSGYNSSGVALNRQKGFGLLVYFPEHDGKDPLIEHIPVERAIRLLGHE